MKSRVVCFDCGTELKHEKAKSEAFIEKMDGGACRVFCKRCAQERNLPEQTKRNAQSTAKMLLAAGIVITTIVFWKIFENNIQWGQYILLMGLLTIVLLFELYNKLK